MKITANGDFLDFSQAISGRVTLELQRFRADPLEQIQLGVLNGEMRIRIPKQLVPGPYRVLREGKPLLDGTVYLGRKPVVRINVSDYRDFDNEAAYRHRIDFGSLAVTPGKDFSVYSGSTMVRIYSDGRASSFDFLLPERKLRLELTEELKQYIDTP